MSDMIGDPLYFVPEDCSDCGCPEDEASGFFNESDSPEYTYESDPVVDTARTIFSIPSVYPWQRIVIANILDAATAFEEARRETGETEADFHDEDGFLRGRQTVILPTGAGKSLCFQIPAMLLPRPTLVVYPLLALMHDQVAKLKAAGIEPVLFKGGQSETERQAQFDRLKSDEAKIIIANPEILADQNVLQAIRQRGISHIAIDEAHCVAEWGDTFRPAYLGLREIVRHFPRQVVTAFTATASPAVLDRITEVLFDGRTHLVRGSSDRENISYTVIPCAVKNPALIRLVATSERPAVVFCGSRGRTQHVAAMLREYFQEDSIRYYHAGLLREEKIKIEDWFSKAERGILCSTCAWGMGVDIKNIRTVIHYDPPPTVEAYIQEAGRGGRDGLHSKAILLWNRDDRQKLENLPEPAKTRAAALITYAESGRCRRTVLLSALGEQTAVEYSRTGIEREKACAGCDVCGGTAFFQPKEETLAEAFVRGNKRRYSVGETCQILCEQANAYIRSRYGKSVWQPKDFAAVLETLQKTRKIRAASFMWKGKLTSPFKPYTPPPLHQWKRRNQKE